MKRTNEDWHVIKKIREAMITRSIHLRQSLPKQTGCSMGKNMIIPDDLRSFEDIEDDKEYRRLRDDTKNIAEVFEKWLPSLDPLTRKVVELKSVPGIYWCEVSKELVRLGIVKRHYSVRLLHSIFNAGIKEIARKFL